MSEKLDPKTIKQIGHEARKPLVSLICTADLLLAGLEGEITAQVRMDIERMKKNAEQAVERVDDLLEALKHNNSVQ